MLSIVRLMLIYFLSQYELSQYLVMRISLETVRISGASIDLTNVFLIHIRRCRFFVVSFRFHICNRQIVYGL